MELENDLHAMREKSFSFACNKDYLITLSVEKILFSGSGTFQINMFPNIAMTG